MALLNPHRLKRHQKYFSSKKKNRRRRRRRRRKEQIKQRQHNFRDWKRKYSTVFLLFEWN